MVFFAIVFLSGLLLVPGYCHHNTLMGLSNGSSFGGKQQSSSFGGKRKIIVVLARLLGVSLKKTLLFKDFYVLFS